MDSLASDYTEILLAAHEPPCLSLYQPTHRHHPENEQDPIRFRNLLRQMEASLQRSYPARETQSLLAPFHALAGDHEFWVHTLDGLAVLGASGVFRFYRLQRTVAELAVVADSFHTKPLMRFLQSADSYQILGLNRAEARLFEGNRDVLDAIDLDPGVPRTIADALGPEWEGRERATRTHGPTAPGATTRQGMDLKGALKDNETEQFFRAVDRAVLEHYSRPSGLPLMLAALPEHHHLFRKVSQNPMLVADAIDVHPDALTIDALRERAWNLTLPRYLGRLASLIDAFGAAKSRDLGASDLAQAAQAAVAGRIATLLIEADREIPGSLDAATGAITLADPANSHVDDLLDDLGERVLKTGGEVVIVPTAQMPTQTGIAAIYRF